MWVCMGPQRAYICFCMQRPEVVMRVLHQLLSILFLTRVSHWIWLGWARRSQGCSCLSSVASTHHCIQLFKCVLENQTQDLMLV